MIPSHLGTCDWLADAEVHCRQGAYAEAIRLGNAALAAATHANDAELVALAQLDLGHFHHQVGNAVETIHLLGAAERHYRVRAGPLLARTLVRQGQTLAGAGDYVRASALYREALALIELQGNHRDRLQEATCHDALGAACSALDEFEKADIAYQRAIPLYGELGDSQNACLVYHALAMLRIRMLKRLRAVGGEVLAMEQLAEEARQFIELGLQLNTKTAGDLAVRVKFCNARSDVLIELGRDDEALQVISESLAVTREMNSQSGQVESLLRLGETCLRLDRIDAALTHFTAAQDIGAADELPELGRNLQRVLAEAYERNGDAARALLHFKRFHQLDVDLQQREALNRAREFALRSEIESALAREKRQQEHRSGRSGGSSDRRVREDTLTGVASRRTFDEWLIARPTPAARAHAVALLNIDHLGEINDRFSLNAGLAVLREAGCILRKQMRATDLVARYGSDEFVIVQAGISLKRAQETLERLREAFEIHDWSMIDPALRVTVSIGVAGAEGNTTMAALTARAKQLLHAAKGAGRNRVM